MSETGMTGRQQAHKLKTPPHNDDDDNRNDAELSRDQYGDALMNPNTLPLMAPTEGIDNIAPEGMELRLIGVPTSMSAHDLLVQLATEYLKVNYAFLVVLEKSSEELFWESFDDTAEGHTMKARVIIPNESGTSNVGQQLIGQYITIQDYGGRSTQIRVEKVTNPETTNHRYAELRKSPLARGAAQGIRAGLVGYLRQVSYGNFDPINRFEAAQFETVHTWSYTNERRFSSLSYLGDLNPPRFRVCLTKSNPGQPLNWEWMDLLEDSIRGVVFGPPSNYIEDQNHQVVYFVVDKPPRFYRRSQVGQGGSRPIHTRISYPASLPQQESGDLDVCGVPWPVQYCRVLKVEYRIYQNFSPRLYEPRMSKERKDAMLCFESPLITASGRQLNDMVSTLRNNLQKIATVTRSCTGCELGLVKLLYNCNLIATSPEAAQSLQEMINIHATIGPQHCRLFTEGLNKMAQDVGTIHARVLRKLHRSAIFARSARARANDNDAEPVLPSTPTDINFGGWHHIGWGPGLQFDAKYLTRQQQQQGSNSSPGVFEVQVYPSHIELQGPIDPTVNSITDAYQKTIDRFLRVKFVENTGKTLKLEAGVSLDNVIEQRVVRILTQQNHPLPQITGLQGFDFLGYSLTGLKKRKAVWFFRALDGLDAKGIRDRIGDWDISRENKALAKHPSKWGARISLAFTEAYPAVSLTRDEWHVRDDYGQHPKCYNTDGCGLVSPRLCNDINAQLGSFGFDTTSRAFQIRFGGVKGIVYAGADSLLEHENRKWAMLLRKSQLKIEVPDSSQLALRIVSTAGDGRPSLFIPSALKAFEDSGADTATIVKIYDRVYSHVTNTTSKGLDILWQIFKLPTNTVRTGMESRYVFLRLAIKLREQEILPKNYASSFLMLYLRRLATKARQKDLFNIPIPGSYSLLGLTDDYQILRQDEVFVRARGKTRSGPVLIYRDPIIHIGDVQKALAVDEKEIRARMSRCPGSSGRIEALLAMDNVIFFSQADNPPFPNRLSGGDLDGDRFEVLTKGCRFWGDAYQTSPPDSYVDDGNAPMDQVGLQPGHHPAAAAASSGNNTPPFATEAFDIGQLARFIGQYIRNDCFAELQDRLLALADQKKDGMRDPDVKDLAKWLSQAVDYVKSGEAVDLVGDVFSNPKFRVARARPDFLRAVSRKAAAAGVLDATGEYYQSSGLLGQLYRRFAAVKYTYPSYINNKSLVTSVAAAWSPVAEQLSSSAFGPDIAGLQSEVSAAAWHEIVYSQSSKKQDPKLYGSGDIAEADMFLHKQPDEFPFNFIQKLLALISAALCGRNIVAPAEGELGKVRAVGSYRDNLNIVESIYRACLYWIWEDSINRYGYPNNTGQSYAFLCLYALYVETMPIVG